MRTTDSFRKYIKFTVYLLVLVLLNVAGLTLFFRADLTRDKIYSISDVSRQVVATLTEPMTVSVFFTRDLPAPHNSSERYLRDLLSEYGASANHYFNYRFYDVNPDQGGGGGETQKNQDLARDYGINPIQIQVVDKDEIKFQKAYMGLVIIHGDQVERIGAITGTDGLEYQLTMAMQKLNKKVSALLALTDQIGIRFYMSESLKTVAPLMQIANIDTLPDTVARIVENLNKKSYGKLAFKRLDPAAGPEIEAELERYQIMRLNWPDIPQENIKAGNGAIGMVMVHGDRSATIPLLQIIKNPLLGTRYQLMDETALQEAINANMESLIDINQRLGILADMGSLPVTGPARSNPMAPQQPVLNNFRLQAGQNYSLKPVNLKVEGLPDNFDCLVIPGPTEPFSDYDLFQIDQFLMKGKSLALFLDPLKEVLPKNQTAFQGGIMGYVPLESGLEKLLAHYGVTVTPAIVMDDNCYKQKLPRERGGGETPIYYAPIIKNTNINHELPLMDNINGLVALQTSPVVLDTDKLKAAGLSAHPLFSSSAQSWVMDEHINFDPRFLRQPGPDTEKKSYPLAYVIAGEFLSYFAGKPIPEKPVEAENGQDLKTKGPDKTSETAADSASERIKGTEKPIEKGRPGKLFIIGSTAMIQDSIMSAGGRSPNDVMVMNVLDYLNNQVDIARLRSKQQILDPLNESTSAAKALVKTANIAGLPVLVVVFGLFVWLRRHRRKKRIQSTFIGN